MQTTPELPPKPSPPARVKQEPGLRPVPKHGRWVWRGELVLPDGSLKTCESKDYEVAAEKLQELRKRYLHILVSPRETLYEVALAWLAGQEEADRDVNTLHTYRYAIEVSIAPGSPGEKLGRKQPIAVTILDLQQLFLKLAKVGGKLGRGLSYNSVVHVKSTLIQIFKRAEQAGTLGRNVAERADLPGKEVLPRTKPTRTPTKQQVEAVLAAAAVADPMVEQYLRLGMGIGTRAGEGLGARWDRLDWKAGTLRLDVTVSRKSAYLYTDGTYESEKVICNANMKNEWSKRTVELPKFSLAALRRRQAAQEEQRRKAGPRWVERGLIFTNDTGGPISHNYMGDRIDKITGDANLGHWTLTKLTRSSFATRSAMVRDAQGNSVIQKEDLAKTMGHKWGSPRMVEQYYIDHSQEEVHSVTAAVLDDVWGED